MICRSFPRKVLIVVQTTSRAPTSTSRHWITHMWRPFTCLIIELACTNWSDARRAWDRATLRRTDEGHTGMLTHSTPLRTDAGEKGGNNVFSKIVRSPTSMAMLSKEFSAGTGQRSDRSYDSKNTMRQCSPLPFTAFPVGSPTPLRTEWRGP